MNFFSHFFSTLNNNPFRVRSCVCGLHTSLSPISSHSYIEFNFQMISSCIHLKFIPFISPSNGIPFLHFSLATTLTRAIVFHLAAKKSNFYFSLRSKQRSNFFCRTKKRPKRAKKCNEQRIIK